MGDRMTAEELAEIRDAAGDKLGFFPSACSKLLAELDAALDSCERTAELANDMRRERDEAREALTDKAHMLSGYAIQRDQLTAARQRIAELEAAQPKDWVGKQMADPKMAWAVVEEAAKEAEQRGYERGVEAAAQWLREQTDRDFGRWFAERLVRSIRQLKPAEPSETGGHAVPRT